jgi:hypothetical protein
MNEMEIAFALHVDEMEEMLKDSNWAEVVENMTGTITVGLYNGMLLLNRCFEFQSRLHSYSLQFPRAFRSGPGARVLLERVRLTIAQMLLKLLPILLNDSLSMLDEYLDHTFDRQCMADDVTSLFAAPFVTAFSPALGVGSCTAVFLANLALFEVDGAKFIQPAFAFRCLDGSTPNPSQPVMVDPAAMMSRNKPIHRPHLSREPTGSLRKLPLEMLYLIFTFLNSGSMRAVEVVSTQWYLLIFASPRFTAQVRLSAVLGHCYRRFFQNQRGNVIAFNTEASGDDDSDFAQDASDEEE